MGLNRGFSPHLYHFQWLIVAEEQIGQFSYEFQIIRSGASIRQIRFCKLQVCLKTRHLLVFHAHFQKISSSTIERGSIWRNVAHTWGIHYSRACK